MVLRSAVAAVAAMLLTLSSSAVAGPKIIHAPRAIPTASGPLLPHALTGRVLFPGLALSRETPVLFPAARPWTDRRYLRGPDFPDMTRQLQGRIPPGPTIPNAANPYRQRMPASAAVASDSPWRGVFRGGRTVEGGSIWRGRVYR